jgi:hypothetical protein
VFGDAVTPSANRGPIRAASLPLPSTELIHGAVASIDTSAVVSIGIDFLLLGDLLLLHFLLRYCWGGIY